MRMIRDRAELKKIIIDYLLMACICAHRENGPRAPQEPKNNGPRMMSVGEAAANGGDGGGGQGGGKAKKKAAAPEAKKPKPASQVKLTAQQLNAKLGGRLRSSHCALDIPSLPRFEHVEDSTLFCSSLGTTEQFATFFWNLEWNPDCAHASASHLNWTGLILILIPLCRPSDTMAKHMDAPDMQLLSLAEHFEEAYKDVPSDAVAWTPSDQSSDAAGWKGMYLALLKDATAQAASEWISGMPPLEIAAFLDFLVGTALPGIPHPPFE